MIRKQMKMYLSVFENTRQKIKINLIYMQKENYQTNFLDVILDQY